MKTKHVPPFVRSEHNYDMDQISLDTGFSSSKRSRTKQSFREETDINTIVRRFKLTGQLPANVPMPTHGDFTEVMDFQGAMNAIAAANEAFDRMPAAIRTRFNNDPAQFVDFCSNEENRQEAEKLGLVAKKAPPPSTPLPDSDQKPPEGSTSAPEPKGGK